MYINVFIFLFLITLIFIFLNIIIFRKYYIYYIFNKILYIIIIYLFLLSIVILLISKSLIIICLGWEGLGVTSYILVLFYYNWNSLQGRFLTFITNRFGDLFIICSIIYWNKKYYFITIIIILLIGITKRALYPYSSWLPAAIAAPTPVSSLVHSRTLVTAGLYLFFRFKIPWFNLFFKETIFIIGTITFLLGAFSCLVCLDVKKIVAFSTLSQLGFILLIFYRLWRGLIIFQLLLHAFLKRFIFMIIGNHIILIYSQRVFNCSNHKQTLSQIFIFMIIIINFIRIIFRRGFILKEIIIINIYLINYIFKIMIFILIIITIYYIKRFYKLIFNKFTIRKLYINYNIFFNFINNIVYYYLFLLFRLFWIFNLQYYFINKIIFKLLLTFSILLLILNNNFFWFWKYYYLINNYLIIKFKIIINIIEELFINNIWKLLIYSLKINIIKWKSLIIAILVIRVI